MDFNNSVSGGNSQKGGEDQVVKDSGLDLNVGARERARLEDQPVISTPRKKGGKLARNDMSAVGANKDNLGDEGKLVDFGTRKSQRCSKPSVKMRDFVIYK